MLLGQRAGRTVDRPSSPPARLLADVGVPLAALVFTSASGMAQFLTLISLSIRSRRTHVALATAHVATASRDNLESSIVDSAADSSLWDTTLLVHAAIRHPQYLLTNGVRARDIQCGPGRKFDGERR